jgi:L-amino acid N-acyltransferase YncA
MSKNENKNLKEKIIGKLKAENAINLSDAEIERCLSGCVAPWICKKAKLFRNTKFIKTSKMKLLAHKKQKEWAVDYNLFLFLRDAGDIGVENIRLKWVK